MIPMPVLVTPSTRPRPGSPRRPVAVALLLLSLVVLGGTLLGSLPDESELPACDSAEVLPLLDRAVREAAGVDLGPTVGHRETAYDGDEDARQGECVVRVGGVDVPVRYQVRWRNADRGLFEVRLLP